MRRRYKQPVMCDPNVNKWVDKASLKHSLHTTRKAKCGWKLLMCLSVTCFKQLVKLDLKMNPREKLILLISILGAFRCYRFVSFTVKLKYKSVILHFDFKSPGTILPRLLLCLHLTYAVYTIGLQCCLLISGIDSYSRSGSLSSVTVGQWNISLKYWLWGCITDPNL